MGCSPPSSMTSAYENSHLRDEVVSPRSRSKVTMQTHEPLAPQPPRSLRESLEAIDMRTDPDVQATVTDFLDFTEHLSSDMIRSLTLIGQLDESYTDFSKTVNKFTTQWSQLPDLTEVAKPSPEGLREAISLQLRLAMRSRIHAHAEAVRMSDNVNRHYNRAATLLVKLKKMLENFPTAEELEKSPIMYKTIIVPKKVIKNGQKKKKNRPPKIIIPGEVLAPYELDDDSMSDASSESSSEEEPEPVIRRPLNLPTPRHKSGSRLGRPPKVTGLLATTTPAIAAAAAAAMGLPKPPPSNAPPGSADAPWLRLTPFELAKLRKRMKKNATWSPSETMIARELNNLGRGPEAYKAAKQKALEEGREFEEVIPPSAQPDTGAPAVVPEGALTAEALADSSLSASNKGMKLNEAKKLKREAMAKMAAEEAEASERKFEEIAKMLLQTTPGPDASKMAKSASRSAIKRKRGGGDDETGYGSDAGREVPPTLATATLDTSTTAPATSIPTTNAPPATSAPPNPTNTSRGATKRIKVETPIFPPKISINTESKSPSGAAGPSNTTSSSVSTQPTHQSTTPVPLPPHVTAQVSIEGVSGATLSVSPSRTGTPGPTRKASVEPVPNVRKSTTPILPPTRDTPRRETRGESAKKQAGAVSPMIGGPSGDVAPTVEIQPARRSSSRTSTPRSTPVPDAATTTTTGSRRPGSRSNSASELSLTVFTNERPRRTSAACVTPQPGDKSPPSTGATGAGMDTASQRAKRPANTTSSGDNSAVGRRKAATRKKAWASKKDKSTSNVPPTTPTGISSGDAEVDEFDEDGTPIDPNEPRYCLCNRVSFGTMIACENDECRFQWFHLGCVDLKEIPRRTTKWYCPDCRKRLNIGEKGQVTSRGIRT